METVWVYSRTKTLNNQTMNKIENLLASKGLTNQQLELVDQNNC
jgi:hypothetical protein